jgi:ankyrin repeat protein
MLGETRKVERAAQFARDGDTALKRACRDGDVEAAQAALERGGLGESEAGEAMVVACVSGRVHAVLPALAARASKAQWHEAWRRAGGTEVVAEMGKGVVQALVGSAPETGVDAKSGKGWTALQRAASGGHAAAVRALLAAGAAVDLAFNDRVDRRAPLWHAAFNGHETVARLLIAASATVDLAKDDGMTPLYIAAQNGHDALVAVLLEAGAAVDLTEEQGRTPLWVAAQNGHEAVVELLLVKSQVSVTGMGAFTTTQQQTGCKVVDQARTACGTTPLFIASRKGFDAVVKLLLASGADMEKGKKCGKTPVFAAVVGRHLSVLKLLIAGGANVQVQAAKGSLMDCAKHVQVGPIISFLASLPDA